jgi:hypothetical protein
VVGFVDVFSYVNAYFSAFTEVALQVLWVWALYIS